MHKRLRAGALCGLLLIAAASEGAVRDAASIERWRQDLAFFRQELPRRHINPFHDLSRSEFESMVADLDRRIPDLRDDEIVVGLARIVAHLGPRDGHSRVNLFNAALRFHALPLNFYWYADGLFVRAASTDYADLAGVRVVSIGGTPVAEAMKRIEDITAADNAMTKKAWAPELLSLREVLDALRIAPGEGSASVLLEVESPEGQRSQRTIVPVESLDKVEWVDVRRKAASPALYLRWAALDPFDHHGPQKNFWFEYLPDPHLLYVNFSSVADAPDETVAAFFDRVFAFADKNRVDKFVLDIRNNGGGNNYLNRPIVHGLIARASTIARPGTFFCIIGRETFSAAQNLANLVSEQTGAILVGEPTGGSPNHFGDSLRMLLPNSKVPIQLVSVWWQDLDPRDFRPWLAPAVAAELTSSDDRNGRDPAFDAILHYAPEVPLGEQLRAAITKGGTDEAARVLASWRSEPRHKFLTGEDEVNRLGAALFGEKKQAEAVAMFEMNATANPESWQAQNNAGRAYAAAGRKAEAREAFARALRIRPNAPQTLAALDQLGR